MKKVQSLTRRQAEKTIAEIVWPRGMSCVHGKSKQNLHAKVIKMLCRLGEVVHWHDNYPGNSREHYPFSWVIQGIVVSFDYILLRYTVGGMKFRFPQTKKEILLSIEAVKTLKRFGVT